MQADIPTLMATIMLASLCLSMVMVVVGWGMPREGLELWAGALALHAAGYVFFGLRGQMDETISIVLSNGFSSLSFTLVLAAVLRFYGAARLWPVLLAPPLILTLLLFSALDDFDRRVVYGNAIFALQAAAVPVVLFVRRKTTVGRGKWLVMGGLALEAVVMAWRSTTGLSGQLRVDDILQSGAVQTTTFLGTFAVMLVTSLGFIFMAKERADELNRGLAAADGLTGVANRRSIIAALDRDVARAIRTREPIAVMMIDLDHFKHVNDAHGHLAGDSLLRSVVQLVAQRIRSQDIIGRYGGEEFLVVLPDTSLKGVMRLGQDLCTAVAAQAFKFGGQAVPITISVGVFGGRLEPGDSWDLLIHAADSALSRAKSAGRNRIEATQSLSPLRRAHGGDTGVETFPPPLE